MRIPRLSRSRAASPTERALDLSTSSLANGVDAGEAQGESLWQRNSSQCQALYGKTCLSTPRLQNGSSHQLNVVAHLRGLVRSTVDEDVLDAGVGQEVQRVVDHGAVDEWEQALSRIS